MASVQDLLALRQAKKSPLMSLLEGAGQGLVVSQNTALDRAKALMDLQERQDNAARAKEMNDKLMQQMTASTEQATKNAFNSGAGPVRPTTPGMKLAGATLGKDGYLKPKFDVVKPKSLQAKEYQDEKGVNRIGNYDPQSGQFTKSVNDPLAPATGRAPGEASDDKFWASQFKSFTPTNAPRGSLIGQAAFGNARADRALETLADPKISPQQIKATINDYAGIMQGGVPHADSIRSMGFGTLLDDFANLKTYIESKPQEANQPEVVAKLKSMISDIKKVDNQIIENNLDTFEATNAGYIERNPHKWQKIRDSVMKSTLSPSETAAASGGKVFNIEGYKVEVH